MLDRRVWLNSVRCLTLATAVTLVGAPRVLAQGDEQVASARPKTFADVRVSIDMTNAPLGSVLTAIARQAQLSEAYSDDVLPTARRVTLKVRDLPVLDAFAIALRGTNVQVTISSTGRVLFTAARNGKAGAVPDTAVVTGTVIDATTQAPISGATVAIEGTKVAVRTDERGAFRLSGVSRGSRTLVVRRLGYTIARKAVTVSDEAMAPVAITLSTSATPLQEVVTTVTGAQRKLEVGNAIGVIKADSLMKEAPVTTISQLLTGRVPGLVVSQGQGTVGGNVKVQIRGTTSLTLSSEPIVIVDGVRYTSKNTWAFRAGEPVSPLNDLNPNDIATVEVVKGPSAATLYGTDASNGVIVITTKRGQAGPARWNAFVTGMRNEIPKSTATDTYYGWASSWNGVPGTVEYCGLEAVSLNLCKQDSVTRQKSLAATSRLSILQPDQSYGYGADVSGGQNALRYLFSATYNNQTGGIGLSQWAIQQWEEQHGVKASEEMRRPNAQTQLNLRSNVTATLSSKLDVGVGANYIRGDTRSVEYSPYVYRASAINNIRDSMYVYNEATNVFARTSNELNNRFLLNANSQGRPTSWLTTRATVGVDMAERTSGDLLKRDTTRWLDPGGSVTESHVEQRAASVDGGITATFRFGRVSTRTSVGTQYVRTLNTMMGVLGSGLPPGAVTVDRAGFKQVTKGYSEAVTLGSYVEETIGLNERLFITGAVRADGASTFGKGFSSVGYPKLSASWLISEEPFMPHLSMLDEIRLRTAYGASGRQPPPNTALPSYTVNTYPAESNWGTHIMTRSLGNPLLRPERGQELETGVDAGFLNRRLQLEFTWYKRQTKDLLVFNNEPAGLWAKYLNAGLVREHGAEAQITATVLDTRLVHWTVTGQNSSNHTKLLRLGSLTNSFAPEGGYVKGYPLGARFTTPIVGYSDTNNDGFISASEVQLGDSAVYMGVNRPPRTQTLTTTVGLFNERLRFSALFDRQSGGTLINELINDCNWCRINFDPTSSQLLQAYRAVRETFKPRLPRTRYIESGSFTRFRELTTTVSLPPRLTRTLRATSGSVSLSVRNLALWSHFSGADPESSPVQDGLSAGSATGIPQSRMWVLRCNLGL